ncbi:MAG: hypothetical protein WCI21_10195 [Alphaproteobacteria bacterium]
MILGWSIAIAIMLIGGAVAIGVTLRLQTLPVSRRLRIGQWTVGILYGLTVLIFGVMGIRALLAGDMFRAVTDGLSCVAYSALGWLMIWVTQAIARKRNGAK